jgi:transcriptional regulator with XRE-family HTH domain
MEEPMSKRLRVLRLSHVWTQEDLGEKSSVPVVTISRLENDHNAGMPRQSTVRKLAAALGVSPAYLLFGEEVGELKSAA